jgi:hypothetical protein
MPVFYAENSAARCYLQASLDDFLLLTRVARTMPQLVRAPLTRPAPASTPAPPRRTGPTPSTAPAAQSAPAAPTASSPQRGLQSIGRGSQSCVDDGNGSFTIVNTTYTTALAIQTFPELLTRCKCVVGAHSKQPQRLCPHWDAAAQSGDASHSVVNTGVHEPIAGLSGVKDTLFFAKQ